MDPARPFTLKASLASRLLGAVEEAPWLERVNGAVTSALEPLLRRAESSLVLDLLHGRWLGHALHPVLSDLPIGFWTASLLLDWLGARWSAAILSAAGSASAVATALSGVADWTVTDGRERRLGLFHGLVNGAALTLQVGSLAARLTGDRRRARRISTVAWLAGVAAAYVGGELVFGRGLMVDHTAWLAGPDRWTPVLGSDDLAEGGTRKVEVEGRAVLLHRWRGAVHALEDTCSHAGGPLSEGEVEDGCVTCPWHGSRFSLSDGAVLGGPATYPQLRLQARVRKGRIEVRGRPGI
ncbi:MAG: Rieske 2Fe-2S domain-containing protein [Candidatus Dormibacteraceae bacterium]